MEELRQRVISSLEQEEKRYRFVLAANVAPIGVLLLRFGDFANEGNVAKVAISIACLFLLCSAAIFSGQILAAQREIISVYHYTAEDKILAAHTEFESERSHWPAFGLLLTVLGFICLVAGIIAALWW